MRRQWRKQHGDEHLGEWEGERERGLVHFIFDEVRKHAGLEFILDALWARKSDIS